MTETSPATGSRIRFLEVVRGLAAGLVVVQHLSTAQWASYAAWSHDHVDLGRVGVVAFFLVSGYVIPLSLEGQGLHTFAVRRFARLYPVYWAALGVWMLLQGTAGQPVSVVLLNVLMVQGLVGAVSLLPPAWTLSIELLFYVQSAIARATGRLDGAVHAGWFWLALYLVLSAGERVLGKDLPTTLPLLMAIAALGHALHLRDAAGSRSWRGLLAATVCVVPVGAVLAVDGDGEWPAGVYTVSALAGLALFLLAYWARWSPAVLVRLGAVSYALYLAHPLVLLVVPRSPGPAGWIAVLGGVVVSLAIAEVVHRGLELPAVQWGRRRTRRAEQTSPVPGARRSPART